MTNCFQTQGVIERAHRILEQKLATQLDASTLSTQHGLICYPVLLVSALMFLYYTCATTS